MKGKLFLFLFFITSFFVFAQEKKNDTSIPTYWKSIKPYQSENASDQKSTQLTFEEIKDLGTKQPNIFLSVDPMADSYPGITPYHYSLNNPVRFIDPTGMWVAEYDDDGNIVNAVYEDGDTYEGLYSQLGISADAFSEQYGIDLSKGITTKSFNISSFVMSNQNFQSGNTNSNCHGFVSIATGNTQTESQVAGNNIMQVLGNPNSTSSPKTGDVAVWSTQGSMDGVDLTGQPAHSAIFVLNNQAGDAQYLQRMGTNHPVTVNTGQQISSFYQSKINEMQAKYNITLPTMSSSPQYYRTK